MSLRNLPEIRAFERPSGLQFEANPEIVARWSPGVRAAAEDDETTVSIYEVIGQDPWTGGGMTAKRMAGILRSIGDKDIVVNINSPGGDLFEGIAIYNLLRAHKGKVTVRVMALAASAASVIAMAGDRIEIARAAFFMVHNCWVLAIGNRHDLEEIAAWLEPFDAAMVDVYAARTGLDAKAVAKLMDNETWIGGAAAVEQGFADDFVPADQVKEDAAAAAELAPVMALRRVDAVLAAHGIPRSERRSLLADVKRGTHDAAAPATHDAGDLNAVATSLRQLEATLRA